MLHHEFDSPLAAAAEESHLRPGIQAILENRSHRREVPGHDLLELQPHERITSAALNPAPRVSILHALYKSKDFNDILNREAANSGPTEQDAAPAANGASKASPTARRKRKRRDEPEELVVPASLNLAKHRPTKGSLKDRKGDLAELEVLFNLWKSAGKNVNLWDWLEAYRITMVEREKESEQAAESGDLPEDEGHTGEDAAAHPDIGAASGIAKVGDLQENGEEVTVSGAENLDEETSARLHATFVRFCEEARVLGLVRARGKGIGRRGDEVTKGIGMI